MTIDVSSWLPALVGPVTIKDDGVAKAARAIWDFVGVTITDDGSTKLTFTVSPTALSGLGTGVATWLATPSSANLAAAVTGETGSGALVFGTSPTIASPTVTGTVTTSGTRASALDSIAEVQTTDATVTTVASYAMSDETLCAFDVVVIATKRTTVTEGGRWKRSVVYRRTGAGVATIVGTLETGTDQETSAGLDVTIDTDGASTVRVRVTGLAATNINWTCRMSVIAGTAA